MQGQTTIETPNLTNMPASGAQSQTSQAITDLERMRERELLKIALNAQKERDLKRLGGVRAYEDFTREKYANKAVLAAMAKFPQKNYYLWGPAGVGKTHAAVAVARETPSAYVIRMAQISRYLRGCETPAEEDRAIRTYADAIMVLDDLGSEKMTEFLQNLIFEIFDRRWQNKRGGLIITANMSIDKLGSIIGDRTASRIVGLVGARNILEVRGKDWRLQ